MIGGNSFGSMLGKRRFPSGESGLGIFGSEFVALPVYP